MTSNLGARHITERKSLGFEIGSKNEQEEIKKEQNRTGPKFRFSLQNKRVIISS